jgi:hypothetical protein
MQVEEVGLNNVRHSINQSSNERVCYAQFISVGLISDTAVLEGRQIALLYTPLASSSVLAGFCSECIDTSACAKQP